MPNVNGLIENMDMREAQRSYEANLNMVTATPQDDLPHPRNPASRRSWPAATSRPAPTPPSRTSAGSRARRRSSRRRAPASDFTQLLGQALDGVGDAGRKADAQGLAVAAGKANVVDVVTAVAESETALQTMVAVRDRMISAYEEIMRMQI